MPLILEGMISAQFALTEGWWHLKMTNLLIHR